MMFRTDCGAACLLGACLLATSSGAVAQDTSLRLSSGFDFASGDYGLDSDTDILTVPWRAALSLGDFELSLGTGFVRVEGPGNVIPGGAGPIVTERCERIRETRPTLFARLCRDDRLDGGPEDARFESSGIGDTVAGLLWSLPASLTGAWLVDLAARVKIPTASESKSLGTGKTDASFSLEIARSFGPLTVWAGGGWRVLGDPALDPTEGGSGARETIVLEDGATATAGLLYSFDGGASVSAGYDYLARTVATASETQEVTLGLSVPLGRGDWRWSGYGVAGLTRSSADFALGFTLSYSFSG